MTSLSSSIPIPEDLTPVRLILILLGLWLVGTSIYRLYLSPIAKFPGPKLAAWTSWYEFYFDVVKGGQFTFHLQSLHQKYGPIIRINPTELHIDDPEYYETIYSNSLHLDKMMSFNHRWNSPGATQATGPHFLHKIRRAALNPFFSKRQVLLLWPFIVQKTGKLFQKIDESYCGTSKSLNIGKAYGCFSIDVITEYAFGDSFEDMENEGFESGLTRVMDQLLEGVHFVTMFPWVLRGMNVLPLVVQEWVQPGLAVVNKYHKRTADLVRSIIDEKRQDTKIVGHKTVLHELLESNLPAEELSVQRLSNEANILIGAGSDTIKHTLTVATFYILSNPTVHKRLCDELVGALPSQSTELSWPELEKLPYLSAVIQEALRLSYGVTQRSPRISWKEPLDYRGQRIPPGYPVSMDAVHMHHNEEIFPDSHKFLPERWLEESTSNSQINGKKLQRYNIAFSRGTRQCVGMNLAYAELYLMISKMFRRYELELYETDVDSVELFADFFLPRTKPGTKGVRVLVKRKEK